MLSERYYDPDYAITYTMGEDRLGRVIAVVQEHVTDAPEDAIMGVILGEWPEGPEPRQQWLDSASVLEIAVWTIEKLRILGNANDAIQEDY